MRITKSQLKQIISEEMSKVLSEQTDPKQTKALVDAVYNSVRSGSPVRFGEFGRYKGRVEDFINDYELKKDTSSAIVSPTYKENFLKFGKLNDTLKAFAGQANDDLLSQAAKQYDNLYNYAGRAFKAVEALNVSDPKSVATAIMHVDNYEQQTQYHGPRSKDQSGISNLLGKWADINSRR